MLTYPYLPHTSHIIFNAAQPLLNLIQFGFHILSFCFPPNQITFWHQVPHWVLSCHRRIGETVVDSQMLLWTQWQMALPVWLDCLSCMFYWHDISLGLTLSPDFTLHLYQSESDLTCLSLTHICTLFFFLFKVEKGQPCPVERPLHYFSISIPLFSVSLSLSLWQAFFRSTHTERSLKGV